MQADGTFIESINQVVDEDTPLMPFRKSDYTYWNSRDTHSLAFDRENKLQNKCTLCHTRAERLLTSLSDYTYPPIGQVKLNPKVPLTLEERKVQLRYLQDHFGYNPIAARDGIDIVKFHLFKKISPYNGKVPSNGTPVDNYRQFVITASLSPRYHEGSYMLKVFMDVEGGTIEVGSVAVLGRGKSASCGNCQAKRAADVRVRGVIMIPHEIVIGVLQAATTIPPPETQQASMHADHGGEVITTLLSSLSSRVVLASGKVHSELSKNASHANAQSSEFEPAIQLQSCDVYQPPLETNDQKSAAPFSFYDWKGHGAPDGKWVKSA